MSENWRAVFHVPYEDVPKVDDFLSQRLKQPNKHYMGHAGRIIIESPTRDDSFRTAEWLRHQNPTGKLLNYTVAGYDEGKIIYVSYCPKCRQGEGRHDEHQKT
jgi:hypothetical protein